MEKTKFIALTEKYYAHLYEIKKPNTYRNYKRYLDRFLESNLSNSEISIDDLSLFLQEYKSCEYQRSTITVAIYSIEKFINWLVINGHLSNNDSAYKNFFKTKNSIMRTKEERTNEVFVPDKVIEKLLIGVKDRKVESPRYERDIALLHVMASSGCSAEELIGLKVMDINCFENFVDILITKDSKRRVYIEKTAVNYLVNYWCVRAWKENEAPAFARHDRKISTKHSILTAGGVRAIIRDVCSWCNIKIEVTPKDFCSYYFSRALDMNLDLISVEQLLKHSFFNCFES